MAGMREEAFRCDYLFTTICTAYVKLSFFALPLASPAANRSCLEKLCW